MEQSLPVKKCPSGGFLVPCRVEGFPLYKGGSYFTDPPRLPASDHKRVMQVLPDIFNGLMETTPEAYDLCALACWQVANSLGWRSGVGFPLN